MRILGGSTTPSYRFPVWALLLLLTSTQSLAPASSQALGADEPVKPAEEIRLSTSAFRAGLKKRGLTELLDLHLREFPPAGRTAALLMRRDLKLTEFADSTRSLPQRRKAVAEANRLLQEVIEENPSDRRRFAWRFTLSHSLIYDEAEPFFTSILYRGGTEEDRRRLGMRTTRALVALTSLRGQIAAEYERIDNLSVRRFERLDRSGQVDRLDRLAPRADYLMLWALLYDSLWRSDTDPVRTKNLHDIVKLLEENSAIIDSPHHTSRVRVQALLLAGMTHRLLNDHASAREYLDRALAVADRLDSVAESERIRWAVTLAMMERIRNDRDDGRFERAIHRIALFRNFIEARKDEPFALALVAALLERSVFQAHALAAEREGNSNAAHRLRRQAWAPLANLVRQYAHRKDEIYAALYDVIGSDADPGTLDPFEQCALVAGLLFDADQGSDEVDRRLDRAIEIGERFVTEVSQAESALVPEVLYNVGVAQYRRGRTLQAARRFLEVARDHSRFERASQAATFAVQLASALYEDSGLHDEPEVRQLYREALETLLDRHAETDAAIYWRFYYAQLLEEQEAYAAAAEEYALVVAGHDHYLQALLLSLRCMARVIESESGGDSPDLSDLHRLAREFADVQRRLIGLLTAESARETDPDRVALLHRMVARARLLSAEVEILPTIDHPERAIEMLTDFAGDYPNLLSLAGRVWRVRLVAYERLGRLDEAARAIPAYIAANPEGAGSALQKLYNDLTESLVDRKTSGRRRAAGRKVELALLLAQQIYGWAQGHSVLPDSTDLHRLRGQLAEANLRARRFERARKLFEECGADFDPADASMTITDVAVDYGYAESLFQLGEFADALPRFNRLAVRLGDTDPIRWRSLLRDLQCRTALQHEPQGILKVILQHRHLSPELGGPRLAAQFEKVLRENQRRLDGGS